MTTKTLTYTSKVKNKKKAPVFASPIIQIFTKASNGLEDHTHKFDVEKVLQFAERIRLELGSAIRGGIDQYYPTPAECMVHTRYEEVLKTQLVEAIAQALSKRHQVLKVNSLKNNFDEVAERLKHSAFLNMLRHRVGVILSSRDRDDIFDEAGKRADEITEENSSKNKR
jgi:16S rRNA C967 or C1407 C5-methylase (RsmB/RsmF family)